MGYLLVALACGAVAATVFAHLTLYHWALRAWPALARARFALAAAVAALFLWPLARLFVRASLMPAPVRALAQFGSTWHVFVLLAMLPYGLVLLAAAGVRRASRHAARGRGEAAPGAGGEAPAASVERARAAAARGAVGENGPTTRAVAAAGAPPRGGGGLEAAGGEAVLASAGAGGEAPPVAARAGGEASPVAARAGGEAAGAGGATLSRRRFVEAAGGGGALAASAGVLGWGLRVSRFDWHVDEVPVRLPRLPRALEGFTVVQISDLHVGPLWRERELRLGLALVASLRPDLVVVTGDIVDYDRSYVPLAARLLGELRAREGVAFVPGNHDHYTGVRAVADGLSAAGLDALVNRGKVVAPRDGGGFALLGVDDMSGGRRGLGPDLERARAAVPPGLATVLLAHQPDFFYRTLRAGGVDLQLSGHTHGGQINPGFVPARLVYEFVAGRYERQSSVLYVNRGFGTVGPPLRAGAPPEITKLVLLAG